MEKMFKIYYEEDTFEDVQKKLEQKFVFTNDKLDSKWDLIDLANEALQNIKQDEISDDAFLAYYFKNDLTDEWVFWFVEQDYSIRWETGACNYERVNICLVLNLKDKTLGINMICPEPEEIDEDEKNEEI